MDCSFGTVNHFGQIQTSTQNLRIFGGEGKFVVCTNNG